MTDYISVEETTIDFGTVLQNATPNPQKMITVKNEYTHNLTLYRTVAPGPSLVFALPPFGVIIPNGATMTFPVSFYTDHAPGIYTTSFTIQFTGTFSADPPADYPTSIMDGPVITLRAEIGEGDEPSPNDPCETPKCPDGYRQAPDCGSCDPPVTQPPPGPPEEKQIYALVEDLTSQELYGVRPNEYQSDLIETVTQAQRVGEQIIWQSNMTVQCQLSVPYNPQLLIGQTIRVHSDNEGIDMTGILKNFSHSTSTVTGLATTQLVIALPEYIFESALGEDLDLRESL